MKKCFSVCNVHPWILVSMYAYIGAWVHTVPIATVHTYPQVCIYKNIAIIPHYLHAFLRDACGTHLVHERHNHLHCQWTALTGSRCMVTWSHLLAGPPCSSRQTAEQSLCSTSTSQIGFRTEVYRHWDGHLWHRSEADRCHHNSTPGSEHYM